MPGLIGKKIGMTSTYDADGKNIPCTIVEAGPCVVTQVKTETKDGYNAIQLGFGERKEKNTPAPLKGHFKKANTTPKKRLAEFQGYDQEYALGDTLDVGIFEEGEFISVSGTSKGKGFQGVVKRHGFAGTEQTHGQNSQVRATGSIGAASYPARIFKGKKMGGHLGDRKSTRLNSSHVRISYAVFCLKKKKKKRKKRSNHNT